MSYHRIVLKLSGEALGKDGWLFDHEKIMAVAKVIRAAAVIADRITFAVGAAPQRLRWARDTALPLIHI